MPAMLLPDVNVLLAGFRPDHAHHPIARSFLDGARGGPTPLGLSDVALSGVLRLATNSRIFPRPDTTGSVLDYVEVLLDDPAVLLTAGPSHWTRFIELCRTLLLRGNLVPDAYLAALALDQGAEFVTLDRGFARYPHLRWRCLLDD